MYVRHKITTAGLFQPLLKVLGWAMLCSMNRSLFLLFLLLFSVTQVVAGVYRWVDASGHVHFSDQPVEGAEKLDLPEPTVYSPRELPGQEEDQAGEGNVAGTPYSRFAVVSPSNNETIHDNEGNVKVSLEIQPALEKGQKFRLFLDGSPVSGELPTPQITLQNVDRGTHTISAAILDQGGIELGRTGEVYFHLRKTSLLDPPARPVNPIERPPYEPPPFPGYRPVTPPDVTLPVEPPDVTLPVEPPEPEQPIAPEPGEETGDEDTGNGGRTPPQGGAFTPNYAPSFRPTYNPRPAAN